MMRMSVFPFWLSFLTSVSMRCSHLSSLPEDSRLRAWQSRRRMFCQVCMARLMTRVTQVSGLYPIRWCLRMVFEDGFAGAGFADKNGESLLLAVGLDVADVLGLMVEELGVEVCFEGCAAGAEVGSNHCFV